MEAAGMVNSMNTDGSRPPQPPGPGLGRRTHHLPIHISIAVPRDLLTSIPADRRHLVLYCNCSWPAQREIHTESTR